MRGRGRATRERHRGSRGRLAGRPSSAAMTASIGAGLPRAPGHGRRRLEASSARACRRGRPARRPHLASDVATPMTVTLASAACIAARERIGVPPGDEILHALHDREHAGLRRVGEGASELGELRERRGDVDPAAGANDRRVGQAQRSSARGRAPVARPRARVPNPSRPCGWRRRSRCSSAGRTTGDRRGGARCRSRSRDLEARGADR